MFSEMAASRYCIGQVNCASRGNVGTQLYEPRGTRHGGQRMMQCANRALQ